MKAFCRRSILWLLSVVMLTAALVCDVPVALAEEPPADSPAPTETAEPPAEPAPTPALPAALPEDIPDIPVLPDLPDPGALMQPAAQMEATAASGDYDYAINGGGASVTITGYRGNAADVVIPSTLGGLPVTAIGGSAFAGNDDLQNIIIPDSVTEIGERVFAACRCLISVQLPAGLEKAGQLAFCHCISLRSITLPATLTRVEVGMFWDCVGLKKVVLPQSLTEIGTGAFCYCDKLLAVSIPSKVQQIGESAFAGSGLVKAFFLGDAPSVGEAGIGGLPDKKGIFDDCSPEFTVNYLNGRTGFASKWQGYTTQTFDPNVTYTVSFDTGEGSPIPALVGGYDLVITEKPECIHKCLEFMGWCLSPERNTEPIGYPFLVSSNITLYARWYPYLCQVYRLMIGYMLPPLHVEYGTMIEALPLPEITAGHAFVGWYPTFFCDTKPITFPYKVKQKETVFYGKTVPIGAYLSDFSLSAGALSSSFNPLNKKYTVTLAENEPGVTLTAGVLPGVSMTINGKAVSSTTVTLANGKSQTVSIKVKCGKKSATYRFTVKRLKSGDNNLAALTGSAGTMNQPFDPNVTSYTLSLDENTSRVTLSAAKANASAKVSPASKKLTLKNGQTKTVKFTVKAQSGAKKVYTVTVMRAPSANANLKTLKTSAPLSPGFNAGVTDYTVTLPADKSAVTVSAKAADKLSAVTIDGLKKPSKKVTLANGQSVTVSVLVTSQSGAAKEYRITIQRP